MYTSGKQGVIQLEIAKISRRLSSALSATVLVSRNARSTARHEGHEPPTIGTILRILFNDTPLPTIFTNCAVARLGKYFKSFHRNHMATGLTFPHGGPYLLVRLNTPIRHHSRLATSPALKRRCGRFEQLHQKLKIRILFSPQHTVIRQPTPHFSNITHRNLATVETLQVKQMSGT